MKKLLPILLSVLLLAATAMPAFAETKGLSDFQDVDIYGYAFADFAQLEEGPGFYELLTWQTINTSDLGAVTELGGMLSSAGNETYVAAAEYINGTVYGYTGWGANPEEYFFIDFDDLAAGNLDAVEYTGFCMPENMMTLDMAYDRDLGILYVITYDAYNPSLGGFCTYLNTVEIASGEITTLGTLSVDYEDYDASVVYSIAAAHGNLYCMLPSIGAAWNGGSNKLCTIDPETCELSVIGSTETLGFQQQSITYDYTNDVILWSHYENQYCGYSNLCAIDPETAETTVLGTIGSRNGTALFGLMVIDSEEPVPPTDEPVPPTDEPVPPTDEPVPPTDEPVPPTDEPVPPTDEPVPPTDEPVPPTDEPVPPTDEPQPPATGAISMIGLGTAALITGAGILFAKKKEG